MNARKLAIGELSCVHGLRRPQEAALDGGFAPFGPAQLLEGLKLDEAARAHDGRPVACLLCQDLAFRA